MSRWISEIIQDKQQRLSAGAQKHSHLRVFEGHKIEDGFFIGETLIARIRRAFLPKSGAPHLQIVKSDKASP